VHSRCDSRREGSPRPARQGHTVGPSHDSELLVRSKPHARARRRGTRCPVPKEMAEKKNHVRDIDLSRIVGVQGIFAHRSGRSPRDVAQSADRIDDVESSLARRVPPRRNGSVFRMGKPSELMTKSRTTGFLLAAKVLSTWEISRHLWTVCPVRAVCWPMSASTSPARRRL